MNNTNHESGRSVSGSQKLKGLLIMVLSFVFIISAYLNGTAEQIISGGAIVDSTGTQIITPGVSPGNSNRPGTDKNPSAGGSSGAVDENNQEGENTEGNSEEPVPTPEPTPMPEFNPYAVSSTEPKNYIKTVGIQVNGTTLKDDEEYLREGADVIDFADGDKYTEVDGIITFRGNNFRDNASYGFANMTDKKFGDSWSINTGSLTGLDLYGQTYTWSGSGWVGQPLIVKWPKETKAIMNMYDWAKQDDNLVEVIYATMDGNIYFLDLNTGKKTRDTLNMGYTFKGAGALDPRGYPIMYVGSGYDSLKGKSRVFVISLIDFKILYEFGNNDSFSLRGNLCYFDASALVDADTDTLIYPGENGIMYIIKLNTEYDEAAGTLSIAPDDVVKWNYYGNRTELTHHWVGMEDSAVIWRGHAIFADNGGNLMCLDLNTLTLDWVQDVIDDTNCSPVLAIEDGHPYVYISTSFHYGWRSYTTATIPIWKIDAETGEIVWHTDYTCYSESGVSGGVQSTAAIGKHDLEGRIYITVSMTDNSHGGKLVCLDTKTGEVIWEHKAYYTWSSPVLVYNEDGSGYVVYCTYGSGTMYLLDGETGAVLDTFSTQGGVEASPAVYKNTIVIGTRQCKIWGVKLK